jgi:hypothetical protein
VRYSKLGCSTSGLGQTEKSCTITLMSAKRREADLLKANLFFAF